MDSILQIKTMGDLLFCSKIDELFHVNDMLKKS